MKKRVSLGKVVSLIFGVLRSVRLFGEVADWLEQLFDWI